MSKILPIVVLVLHVSSTLEAARTIKIAVVIGNNEGQQAFRNLRYAESDARKVSDVLSQLGSFLPRDTHLLIGATAGEVRDALRRVEQRLKTIKETPGARSLLLVYYSGHAEGDGLELGKTTFSFAELTRYLRRSSATVRLAFIDSCQSGRLVAMKGGRRGPAYHLQVADEIESSGYAVVTSSSASELSQEAAEIRGSFFTHYLVSALRGAGDHSGDGKVTLAEAYRYAYSRTVARTSVTVGGIQHPMYDFKLSGRGDIVLTRMSNKHPHLVVDGAEPGRIVILDAHGLSVIAESASKAGKAVRLALAPGRYIVYWLSNGRVRRAQVRLEGCKVTTLSDAEFTIQKPRQGIAKGGLFARSTSHRLGAGFVLRRMPLEQAQLSYGALGHYRVELPSGWQPTVRVAWTTAPDAGVSTGYLNLGVHAGLGHVWHVGRIALRSEALVGYEHLAQHARGDQARHTSMVAYMAQGGVELPWAGLRFVLDAGVGGRVFQVLDKGWVHRLDLLMTLGVGWQWGA